MAKRRLRLLHTADWHLGHTLHDFSRDAEHAAFLDWLRATIVEEQIDALLVAGDVFDQANPSTAALAAWYRFLGGLATERPSLDVVVIGGNHDSAQRLDAPNPLLASSRVRVLGGRSGRAPGELVVPIGQQGARAFVAAVPFLRPADLPASETPEAVVEAVAALHREVVDAARAARGEEQAPLLAMGHLHLAGGALSELSERKILAGNQHALPATAFPDELAYVALGHLHKAQAVGGRQTLRYSGSPLPLSVGEAGYEHEVRLVELDRAEVVEQRALRVPRHAPMVQLGHPVPLALADALSALQALPRASTAPPDRWAFVDVQVRLPQPEPTLVRQLQDALEGRAARLVRVGRVGDGTGAALAEAAPARSLRDLLPEDVFRLRWAKEHAGEPPAELLSAFREALDAAEQGEGT